MSKPVVRFFKAGPLEVLNSRNRSYWTTGWCEVNDESMLVQPWLQRRKARKAAKKCR